MTRMADRSTGRLVWLLAASGVGLIVAVSWLTIEQAGGGADAVGEQVGLATSLVAFVLSGALIVSRQPGNPIGWLLMIPGLAALSGLGSYWLQSLDPVPTTATVFLWLVLWVCGWSWMLLIFPILHILLTFPDGHLLSPRWRVAVALELVMVATMLVVTAVGADMILLVDDEPVLSIPNPIGSIDIGLWEEVAGIWALGLLALTAAGVLAIALRYRRGSIDVRQRLKWPLLAIAFFAGVYGSAAIPSNLSGTTVWNVLFVIAIAAIPVSIAVAVLRYRLYDIDRVISRSVSWALVTALVVGLFAIAVLGLQAIMSGVTQGQTFAVAGSTLLAAVAVSPIRARVQRVVDRRFDRTRYDAERTVERFGSRLRNQVDLQALTTDLRRTATEAVQPTSSTIWLRGAPALTAPVDPRG